MVAAVLLFVTGTRQ